MSETTQEAQELPATVVTVSSEQTDESTVAATASLGPVNKVGSIRKRVSVFESSNVASAGTTTPVKNIFADLQKKKAVKSGETARAKQSPPAKLSMLEEMKAKAAKRKAALDIKD